MIPPRESLALWLCAAATVAALQVSSSSPPKFKVAVDAVTIDAVVTDQKGQIVRDLTAADFEVLQDGKPQKVKFVEFVPAANAASIATEPDDQPAASLRAPVPTQAPPVPRRADIGRTIIVLVDDLGLSVEGITNTRRGLGAFIDNGLLPSDSVAILRTGEVRGTAHALTNDRRALHGTIEDLHYNTLSRKGVSPSGDVIQLGPNPPEFDDVGALQRSTSIAGSLAALSLVVQAARDLPGRKAVIFASEGFQLAYRTGPAAVPEIDQRMRYVLDRVVDQSLRAGVVIYAIDSQALQTAGLRASDDIHSIAPTAENRDAMAPVIRQLGGERLSTTRDAQASLQYLAEQTGGYAVLNTNDLASGFNRISSDLRAYYIIGYEPDGDTFSKPEGAPRLHRVSVSVKRGGLQVRTRKEFLGMSDPTPVAEAATAAQQLVRAALSPFTRTAIQLHQTSLPAYSKAHGLFIRIVLHLDAQAFTYYTNPLGKTAAAADLVAMLFDSAGMQVNAISKGFDVTLENDAAKQAIASGIVFTLRLPVEKPGGYQLRYAVRDRRSGAIGSVGGFVNVPDVKNGQLAISGIVLRTDDGVVTNPLIDSDMFSLDPHDALRVYRAGSRLRYSCEFYNVTSPIQLVLSVWRGNERIAVSQPETLTLPNESSQPLLVDKPFQLGHSLSPGRYVFQVVAETPGERKGGARRAIQQSDFEVK